MVSTNEEYKIAQWPFVADFLVLFVLYLNLSCVLRRVQNFLRKIHTSRQRSTPVIQIPRNPYNCTFQPNQSNNHVPRRHIFLRRKVRWVTLWLARCIVMFTWKRTSISASCLPEHGSSTVKVDGTVGTSPVLLMLSPGWTRASGFDTCRARLYGSWNPSNSFIIFLAKNIGSAPICFPINGGFVK